MYDPQLVQPFRDELTALGVQELLTPDSVDTAIAETGTTLVFVNSVCGCAAAGARPGLRLSMMNEKKPDRFVTVFAGMEADATAKAREHVLAKMTRGKWGADLSKRRVSKVAGDPLALRIEARTRAILDDEEAYVRREFGKLAAMPSKARRKVFRSNLKEEKWQIVC